MRNLMNKLGLIAGLGMASTIYTGCTTPEGFFSLNPEHATPAQKQAIQQAVVGGLAGYGIMNHGIQSGNTAQVVLGQAVMDGAMQQSPQTTVVVNGPPQQHTNYPQQTIAHNSPIMSTLGIFLAQDLNRDGTITPEECLHEQYNFTLNDTLGIRLVNVTGKDRYVRATISQNGSPIIVSEFVDNKNNMYQVWSAIPIGRHLRGEGDYNVSITDNEGNVIGQRIFAVKPAVIVQTNQK